MSEQQTISPAVREEALANLRLISQTMQRTRSEVEDSSGATGALIAGVALMLGFFASYLIPSGYWLALFWLPVSGFSLLAMYLVSRQQVRQVTRSARWLLRRQAVFLLGLMTEAWAITALTIFYNAFPAIYTLPLIGLFIGFSLTLRGLLFLGDEWWIGLAYIAGSLLTIAFFLTSQFLTLGLTFGLPLIINGLVQRRRLR